MAEVSPGLVYQRIRAGIGAAMSQDPTKSER